MKPFVGSHPGAPRGSGVRRASATGRGSEETPLAVVHARMLACPSRHPAVFTGGPIRDQSLESQLGEIRFRRLLAQQQVEGRPVFEDEFDAEGICRILEQRMLETTRAMERLRERGVALSPYLELGAERGQRALVLENDLGAAGAAADLSLDMLRSAAPYAQVFPRPPMPLRV